jgi:hypothetical protein
MAEKTPFILLTRRRNISTYLRGDGADLSPSDREARRALPTVHRWVMTARLNVAAEGVIIVRKRRKGSAALVVWIGTARTRVNPTLAHVDSLQLTRDVRQCRMQSPSRSARDGVVSPTDG